MAVTDEDVLESSAKHPGMLVSMCWLHTWTRMGLLAAGAKGDRVGPFSSRRAELSFRKAFEKTVCF